MRAIAKGTNCTLRISVSDVGKIQNAKKIDTHIVSPSSVVSCVGNAYDELVQEVVVSIDGALFNEAGLYSVDMRIVYEEETVAVPTIAFAEVVDSNESECEDYAVIDIEVKGGNVTPSEGEVVELVERKEFDALEGRVEDLEQRGGGGGNSDNNYTNADKALVQTIPSKVDRSEFEDTLQEMDNSYGEIHGNLYKEIETKANKKGYYKDLSVGMADNLVGRGDVQDAHINFRPSAGADNITDHAARIERIKGNSVVWNSITPKRNGAVSGGVSHTISDSVDSWGGTSTSTTTGVACKLVANHKYYLASDILENPNDLLINFRGFGTAKVGVFTASGAEDTFFWEVENGSSYDGVKVRVLLVDLTKMFGAGNEPTIVEEYRQRKPMNIEDEFAYNAGTLVDMKVNSLVSVSDNAYDYTKGYARVMGGVPYTFTVDNRKDITPEEVYFSETLPVTTFEENIIYPNADGIYTFPSDGYAKASFAGYEVGKEDTICICLKHSYDKPHPAYQQEVKDLSWIWEIKDSEGNLLFPNGMRSAGSAYDEIRFNPTKKKWEAEKRVESRAFAEGDAEDTTVKTDGATTNYPLAKPIVVELDYPTADTNMDYLVWDFGTEEAVASVPSAPFSAHINYEPNAVDDLRWAVSEIRSLKAQLAQMQTSVTNLTE